MVRFLSSILWVGNGSRFIFVARGHCAVQRSTKKRVSRDHEHHGPTADSVDFGIGVENRRGPAILEGVHLHRMSGICTLCLDVLRALSLQEARAQKRSG